MWSMSSLTSPARRPISSWRWPAGLDVLPADGIQPVQVVGQGADRAGDAAGDDPRHPQGDRHHLEGEEVLN